MKNYVKIIGWLLFASALHAQELNQFTLGPYKQVTEARVQAWNFGGDAPKAMLVITPGYGLNPSGSTLKEIEAWKEHAKVYGFVLAFVDFKWVNVNAAKNPFDGGAEILAQIAQKIRGENLQVFIFSRSETGNRFALDCDDKNIPQLGGWFCYGGKTWPSNPKKAGEKSVPGIIASTTDSIWFEKAREYYNLGRKAGKNWTWLGYDPVDSAQTRDFACHYFAASLLSRTAHWRSIETRDEVKPSLLGDTAEGWSWFPDRDAGDLWSKIQRERKSSLSTVIEQEIDLSKQNLPNLKMYLRLPPGKKDASGVDGVVAYCTWTQDRNSLIQQLSYDINQPAERMGWPAVQLLRFATQHNLAVVTWSTPGKWQKEANNDELERDAARFEDKEFDVYAKAWARGIEFFRTTYQLPKDQYLLYGMSRGAQWAHRLALRLPKYFLAVNSHVSGSYDKLTPEARNCLWLITTGEVDGGYENSISFYRQCLAAGYPVIFKAGQDLGHETRPDIEALRDAFFEYALLIKDEFNAQIQDQKNVESLFKTKAKFIGNLESQRIVPIVKIKTVSEEFRVYLPTEELAEAWKLPPPEIE